MSVVERMTREQMLAEFGEPGVQNPKVVDLITVEGTDKVVLVMVERRPWGSDSLQLRQIEEKINRYMGFVLDGFLVQQHPEYKGRSVQIRLDCSEAPHGEATAFVQAAAAAISGHDLEFVVNVVARQA